MSSTKWLLVLAALYAPLGMAGAAGTPEMPWNSSAVHLGVGTCAASNCHGARRPFDDAAVMQNEYFTWQREDAHSNAYQVLLTPASQRIAAKLGIGAAHEAPACLVCHTDFVPRERRGASYSITEGVGCEACHGGAENWIDSHVSGNTHRDNLADGLFPLPDPVHRARLCLNCHMGTGDKPIDHKIMGAGHPRLEFELDTFTNIQPAHFRPDEAYRKRKDYTPGAKTWALGQLIAAETFLKGLQSARFNSGYGIMPELVFYDCGACHRPMRPLLWTPGAAAPLGPGEVRLADAYLVMSGHIITQVAPDLARDWQSALDALHRAANGPVNTVGQRAREMEVLLGRALTALRAASIERRQALSLMDAIARSGIERDAAYLATAKQIFYGLEALATFIRQEDAGAAAVLGTSIDRVFDAVDAAAYEPDALRAGLRQVRTAVAGLQSR
jgi:hypothetical protein